MYLFWFAMLVNEYKPEFYVIKVRKMRNLGNVYISRSPFVMSRTDAQNGLYSPFSTWRFFSREQTKSECDWLVMSSVFVASQSSCFFLCSREQIRLVENRLYMISSADFHPRGRLLNAGLSLKFSPVLSLVCIFLCVCFASFKKSKTKTPIDPGKISERNISKFINNLLGNLL